MKMPLLKNVLKQISEEKRYPFYVLAIGAFVLFFQLEGSIGNWDEAIYCEVAKEGLLRNDWLSLWYKDGLWFEKPPLLIWLTMISYKMFGVSEFSSWFFPVIFGIMGILGVYYLGKLMFNPKIGFLASLALVMTPHYLLMARNNMTDVFLFATLIWSFVFFIKTGENGKYLILSSVFIALAFMTKSFASVLIYPVMAFWLHISGMKHYIKKSHIIFSLVAFLALVLPWHIFMYAEYGRAFIDNYIGLHVVRRFNNNILDLKYSSDNFYYFKVLLQRSASWWFVLIAFLPLILKDIKKKINRKEILVLLFWMIFFLAFYSASKTKLHHYILPAYAPLSLLIAYGLYYSHSRRSILILMPLFLIFMNIDPAVIRQVSDSGETRLVIPLLLYKYFHLTVFFTYMAVSSVIAGIFYIYFKIDRSFASKTSIMTILLFSVLIPFNPDRAPLAKEIGKRLKEENVEAIRHMDYKNLNIDGSLVFYSYPAKVISYRKKVKNEFNATSSTYCLIDRSKAIMPQAIAYDFYPCDIIE